MAGIAEQALKTLAYRINTYDFLASLFLTLPDDTLAEKIREPHKSEDMDDSIANQLLIRYSLACINKSTPEILQELGVDRAKLLRGLREDGPRPPYESLFLSANASESCVAIMDHYLNAGLAPIEDVHEPPDYLGVEFNFMATLCRKEYDALKRGNTKKAALYRNITDDFLFAHTGQWAGQFALEMQQNAQTDFYRGIAFLISDFMREEMDMLSTRKK